MVTTSPSTPFLAKAELKAFCKAKDEKSVVTDLTRISLRDLLLVFSDFYGLALGFTSVYSL